MKNTRQKILNKSKELFNTNGSQATTLRQIAVALGISQGNLNYHFKLKQDIVEGLYFELVQKMDLEIHALSHSFSAFSALHQSAESSMQILYEYRFLTRDMYLIFRESDKIRAHYITLQEIRKVQFLSLFELMIENKLLRQEELSNEYDRLYERMNILGDNWINAFELFRSNHENPAKYYLGLLFEVIYPYLTDIGKKQFMEIYQ